MNSQVADLVGDRDGGRASTPRSHPYPFPLPRITTAAKKPLTVEEADSFTSSQAGIQGRVTGLGALDSRFRGNDRGEKGNRLAKCDCPAGGEGEEIAPSVTSTRCVHSVRVRVGATWLRGAFKDVRLSMTGAAGPWC